MEFWHGRQLLIRKCQFIKMKKQIAFNTFYTIGIVISVLGLKWAIENSNYPIVALLVAIAGLFLYLKINLVKEVKKSIKEKEDQYNSSLKDRTN